MSRWKYPFNRREDAEKHLRIAQKETKEKCLIRKFTVTKNIYKIFTSEAQYRLYKKVRGIK